MFCADACIIPLLVVNVWSQICFVRGGFLLRAMDGWNIHVEIAGYYGIIGRGNGSIPLSHVLNCAVLEQS